MNVFPIGEYIRQGRLDQKLTQEKLCEGICEAPTLSRLENGTQTPSRNRVIALLQRLGLPDDRFYALLTPNEMEIAVLQKEISAASVWYSSQEGEKKRQARDTLTEHSHLKVTMQPGEAEEAGEDHRERGQNHPAVYFVYAGHFRYPGGKLPPGRAAPHADGSHPHDSAQV